jgi:hypothetical protein
MTYEQERSSPAVGLRQEQSRGRRSAALSHGTTRGRPRRGLDTPAHACEAEAPARACNWRPSSEAVVSKSLSACIADCRLFMKRAVMPHSWSSSDGRSKSGGGGLLQRVDEKQSGSGTRQPPRCDRVMTRPGHQGRAPHVASRMREVPLPVQSRWAPSIAPASPLVARRRSLVKPVPDTCFRAHGVRDAQGCAR